MKKSISIRFAEHSAIVFTLFMGTIIGLAYYFSFVAR